MAAPLPSPKPLIDKLGVKPGMRISILGAPAVGLRAAISERTRDYLIGQPQDGSDIIFLCAVSRADLVRIEPLVSHIRQNGAIWIIYPKGLQTITQANVMEAGLAAGLVDNRVVSFSDTQTALRFVIPVARRK